MKISRLFDILEGFKEKYNKPDVLALKKNKIWNKFSSAEYIEAVDSFSIALLELGVKKGDKVATVSTNRPEWNVVDMGLAQIGAIHVPIYPTISEEEHYYVLNHSEARVLFISDKSLYRKIKPLADKVSGIEKLYTFDELDEAAYWLELIALGKENKDKYYAELQLIKDGILPTDVVSIIYTSGTTGVSKGVMLTHNNFISNIIAANEALPLNSSHKILSFLPLCHVYERCLNYIFQYRGVSIYYAENMGTIIDNLKEIKADGFDTVPRLLEKVYDTIMGKAKDLSVAKKFIFNWALNLGLNYDFTGKSWIYKLQLRLANKLVFKKWREALGGNIKFIGCGGAALQPRLTRVFWAAGIPIQEGYGLTETSPLVAINHYKVPDKKIGTVGPIVKGVSVKIADDGEILVKGPNVMLGYYKAPELTNEVLTSDGWFHTGDIGTLLENKFLQITDRKKEMFKISSGKYIAPQVIENKLKESIFIENVMVVGENEKFVSALIAPNFDYLHGWAVHKKLHFADNFDLIKKQEVLVRIQQEVNEINKELGQYEEVKRIRIVPDVWGLNTGELSSKMSLKRKVLQKKYKAVLEEIYGK